MPPHPWAIPNRGILARNEWEARGTASRHVPTSGVVRVAMNLFIQWSLDRSPWSSKRVAFRSERRSAKSPVLSEFTLGLAAGVNRVGGIKRQTGSLRIGFDCEGVNESREESVGNEFVRPGQKYGRIEWGPGIGESTPGRSSTPEAANALLERWRPRGFRRSHSGSKRNRRVG